MSNRVSLSALAARGLTAFAVVAVSCLMADAVTAEGRGQGEPELPPVLAAKAPLDEQDQIAALETIQFALTQVADGSSYVWHRGHGRLSGIVKPVSSFKDMAGGVCRHAVVVLSASDETKRTEIVACRLASGIWQLEN